MAVMAQAGKYMFAIPAKGLPLLPRKGHLIRAGYNQIMILARIFHTFYFKA